MIQGFTGRLHLPAQHFVIGWAEQVFADDAHPQRRGRQQRELKILLGVLRLHQRRMRRAIGKHQTVHTELAIVRLITKVAAIGPADAAVGKGFADRLVGPVPDKPALQPRVLAKGLPVIGEVAEAVAHRVGVLAKDQRPLLTGQADPFFDPPFGDRRDRLVAFDAGVHRTDNIGGGGICAAALVLHRTARVVAFQPVVQRFVVAAAAGFIAQRPDDNARMVAVALYHPGDAGAEGWQPRRIVGQPIHRHHPVGFNIGFIDHVQTVAVAEFIPARRVGIVRAAHGVKVVLLHQQNVLHHIRLGDHLPAQMMMLMAVNAADQQRFTVETQQAIGNLDAAKTDVPRFGLQQFVAAPQGDHGAITVRGFRAPVRRRRHRQGEIDPFRVVAALIHRRGT